jgi:hypothetical protein
MIGRAGRSSPSSPAIFSLAGSVSSHLRDSHFTLKPSHFVVTAVWVAVLAIVTCRR